MLAAWELLGIDQYLNLQKMRFDTRSNLSNQMQANGNQ
jgi:hypothetical protein